MNIEVLILHVIDKISKGGNLGLSLEMTSDGNTYVRVYPYEEPVLEDCVV